ncbi:MAG: arsenosugar biosynthesis radical SAM protein ArsS [Chloroflexi bacterium]|nr:arsenosugar biosynthesis radical SAM protein ArsS [Chloroflexota bacterium]
MIALLGLPFFRDIEEQEHVTMSDTLRPVGLPSFQQRIEREGIRLQRTRIDTVQLNLGRLCNQSCTHCHLEAGPHRTEIMSRAMAELAVDFVAATEARTVDITGGAPELNSSFRWLVERLVKEGRHVIDRCNLTALYEPGQQDTPNFLAEQGVEIVASMPCYTRENVDQQRGGGVFDKSIAALRRLNELGYGREGSGLVLNVVYNPIGAFLPPSQRQLEAEYKQELASRFAISFNQLLTMVNMPLGRFANRLKARHEYDTYWASLAAAFNPSTLDYLMCRNMVSVAWDGFIYDCDFNQAMGLRLRNGKPIRLGESPAKEVALHLVAQEILVGLHCYGCTADAGSSCQGALQYEKKGS